MVVRWRGDSFNFFHQNLKKTFVPFLILRNQKKMVNGRMRLKSDVKFSIDIFSYKNFFIEGRMQPEKPLYRKMTPFYKICRNLYLSIS
jgi:hypothetical protein